MSEKRINELKSLKKDDLRTEFKNYLSEQEFKENTIKTHLSDALYIYRHENPEIFWEVITDPNFPEEAINVLKVTLERDSKGDLTKALYGYKHHLKSFREFVYDDHIPTPSPEEVKYYLKRWKELRNYPEQEKVLVGLFREKYPNNTDLYEVLGKVSILDRFYSTQLTNIIMGAENILNLDFDKRVQDGDISLVEEMRKGFDRNEYSFSTKYCSFHNPTVYPIYDSFVNEVLWHFKKVDGFSSFLRKDLEYYPRFVEIIEDFRKYYGLEEFSLKEIDRYLWQLGKRFFNKERKSSGS